MISTWVAYQKIKQTPPDMPNRIVRVGFLDSEAVSRITEAAECFYHRLLLVADDAGRFDGRIDVMRSSCYPLGTRRGISVENSLRECVGASLLYTYEYRDKPFVQVTKWQRCGKALTSKYPDRDGRYDITYVPLSTRDGVKDFVSSSLPFDPLLILTPSAPHVHGVGGQKKKTNTETETETETGAPHPIASQESAGFPTLEEWKSAAQIAGLVEWKAVEEWYYQAKLDPPWRGVGSWRGHLSHTRVKWEQAGRPMHPPGGKKQVKYVQPI